MLMASTMGKGWSIMVKSTSSEYRKGYTVGFAAGKAAAYNQYLDSSIKTDHETMSKMLEIYRNGNIDRLMEQFAVEVAKDSAHHMRQKG